MPLLEGKRLLVTGVLPEASIAVSVARLAAEQGATVVLSSPARSLSVTCGVARRLPGGPQVVELDVTSPDDLAALPDRLAPHVDALDGVLHAIGHAPSAALGPGLLGTSWEDVGAALQVSTWSFAALAQACRALWAPSASYVGVDVDATRGGPSCAWTAVATAGLESANRYLARDLGPRGVRVNLVAAGPATTTAATSTAGAQDRRPALGGDVHDPEPVARACVALLSDWFPKTTGCVVHVDGGSRAVHV